ncbi:MAG: hypothetical protein HKN47_24280, partial [Pirellulaceae bacterium]|nr:hypothetical protein [Pirellulaceae bacterium]
MSKRNRAHWLCLFAAAVSFQFLFSVAAQSSETLHDDVEERLARLEAEWYALKSQSTLCASNSRDQQSCSSRCSDAGLYAGAGVVFAKPHFKESFQYSQINFGTGEQSLVPFSYDYDATPSTWLGYRSSNGLGILVDYWQFDHAGNRATAVSDGVNIYTANATTVI